MGLCASKQGGNSAALADEKARSKKLEKMLTQDKYQDQQVSKLLLLGMFSFLSFFVLSKWF